MCQLSNGPKISRVALFFKLHYALWPCDLAFFRLITSIMALCTWETRVLYLTHIIWRFITLLFCFSNSKLWKDMNQGFFFSFIMVTENEWIIGKLLGIVCTSYGTTIASIMVELIGTHFIWRVQQCIGIRAIPFRHASTSIEPKAAKILTINKENENISFEVLYVVDQIIDKNL